MFPFLLPALKFAAPAVAGLLAGKKGGAPAPSQTQNRYDEAMRSAGTRSGALQAEGDKRMLAFDPTSMLRGQIEGYANQERAGLNRSLDALAGRAVGAGRLNTGFFDLDQGDLVRESDSRLQDVIAQTAGQATALTAQNNQAIAGAGREAGDDYMDLVAGQLDREQADRNARTQSRNGMLSAGAGLLGSFLGTKQGGTAMEAGVNMFRNAFGKKRPSVVGEGPTTLSPISMSR